MVRVNQTCGTARAVIPGRLSIVDALLLVNACLACPDMSVASKARCWGSALIHSATGGVAQLTPGGWYSVASPGRAGVRAVGRRSPTSVARTAAGVFELGRWRSLRA